MARSRSRSRKKSRGKNGKSVKSGRSPSHSCSRGKSASKSTSRSRDRPSREKKQKKTKKEKNRRGKSGKSSSRSRGKSGSRSRDRRSREKKKKQKDRRGKSSSSSSRDRRSKGRKRSSSRQNSKSRRSRGKRSGSRDRRKKSHSRGKRNSRSRSRKMGGFGKDAVTSAPAEATATVTQAAQAASGGAGVPDWLSDLMGGASAAPAPQSVPSEPLQIPGALASLLSNDSPAIKSIIAQTGATVSIRGDCMHLGYSLAFFTGAPEAVAKAREMVQMQVGLSERTTITKEIEMSAELLAEGHVDAVLATLQQRGTIVPIAVQHTDAAKNLVKIVLGPGPVAYVSTAEALMRKKIDGWLTDGGRQLCGQFRKGNCTFGANCKFRHGLELSSRKAVAPQAAAALEALPPPPPPAAPAPPDDRPPPALRTSATSGML